MSFSIFSERRARAVPAALLALAPGTDALAQCAMCARAAEGSQVGRGLSLSILFLLGVLVLTVCWLVVLVVRRGRAGEARELPKEASSS